MVYVATRSKLMTQCAKGVARRQHKSTPLYTQPEENLGEVLAKHGSELGNTSGFGGFCRL